MEVVADLCAYTLKSKASLGQQWETKCRVSSQESTPWALSLSPNLPSFYSVLRPLPILILFTMGCFFMYSPPLNRWTVHLFLYDFFQIPYTLNVNPLLNLFIANTFFPSVICRSTFFMLLFWPTCIFNFNVVEFICPLIHYECFLFKKSSTSHSHKYSLFYLLLKALRFGLSHLSL